LIKRYSSELDQEVELVAKCLETERLSQLEKQGKLGIPNDFLYTTCKCNRTDSSKTSEESKWTPCKCDLDTKSVESFLVKLGLPMYLDALRGETSTSDILRLFDMSKDELEAHFCIQNKSHLETIVCAVQNAKLII
jgi:hypothetical protein